MSHGRMMPGVLRMHQDDLDISVREFFSKGIRESGVRTFSWTGYATNPRLCLYSIGLKYPNDFFILFSLYQRR